MKTLLFTLEFPPFKGGIANYYGNLTNYWPLGEELVVLNNNKGELDNYHGFLSWWRSYGELKRKISSSKIDYVIVGHILPLGTVAMLLSLFQPLKYAVFLHGLDWTSALKSWRKRILVSFILRRSDRIICANSYVAARVNEFYPSGEDKVAIINPGVASQAPYIDPLDLQDLQKTYNLENKITLFSLGRLIKRKGVDQTIKALASIPKSLLNNLVYFIAGTGSDESYLRKLVPQFLHDKIIFLGEISEKEKWLWLKQADIFLMPARDIEGDYEGFGIVYLEANLSSCPVIAGNSGGVPDAVEDNYSGLLVDPLDSNSIKEAIITLANDKELRQKLGRQGRERAINDFNWEKQISQLASLITH